MNKKRVINFLIILIIALFSSVVFTYKKIDNKKTINRHNTFAVMVEQNENQKDYLKAVNGEFPNKDSDKYKLNKTNSYCFRENDEEDREWHDYLLQYIGKKVIYKSNIESHCVLYFDIDNVSPDMNKVDFKLEKKNDDSTPGYTNTLPVTANISWEEMDDIDYYCIAISNDSSSCEWKELTIKEKMSSSIIADYSELEERRNERYLFLKDEAGNVNPSGKQAEITYDKTKPVCEFQVSGPTGYEGDNGWYKKPITLTMNITENGSGVKAKKVNDNPYNGSITINNDTSGDSYTGIVIDNAGNTSDACQITIKIDTVVPEITTFNIGTEANPEREISTISNRNAGLYINWGSDDVKKYCVVEGNTTNSSLCNGKWKDINPGSKIVTEPYQLVEEGTKTLTAFIKDEAGNISSSKTDSIEFSLTKPSATIEAKKQSSNTVVSSGSWSNEKLKFTIDGTIEEGELTNHAYYCLGSSCTLNTSTGTGVTRGSSFNIETENATYYIKYMVEGKNGATSIVGAPFVAKVDTVSPVITLFRIGGSDNPEYTPTRDTTVYIKWNETSSTGVSPIKYYCISSIASSSGCIWKDVGSTDRTNKELNKGYTFENNTGGSKTLYAFLKDEAGNISVVNSNSTDSIIYDKSVPQTTLSTTSNLKSDSQTVTLTCSDDGNIDAYYWGTTEPTEASDLATTTGLASLSTGLTKTVSTAGTYYFACKDKTGKMSDVRSKTFYKYTVDNRLLKVTGDSATYTSSEYASKSSNTYIAPKNTELTLSSIYTIPSHSSTSRFQGYSLGAASTTAAVPANTDPKLSANNKTYTMWFWRNIIYIKYKVQSGETLAQGNNKTYSWSKDSNNYVVRTDSNGNSKNYPSTYWAETTSINLYDNSPLGHFAITKSGYVPASGSEWTCVSGCASGVSTITQAEKTISNSDTELCNTSNSDCTIVLKVNWKSDSEKPTCSLTVNTSLGKVVFNEKKDNYAVVGFDLTKSSTPTYTHISPSDPARADLSAGTFYGYVKDQAGNVNKCTLTISSINRVKSSKTCNPKYEWKVQEGELIKANGTCKESGPSTCNASNKDATRVSCEYKMWLCRKAKVFKGYRCYCECAGGSGVCYEHNDYVTGEDACRKVCGSYPNPNYINLRAVYENCPSGDSEVTISNSPYCQHFKAYSCETGYSHVSTHYYKTTEKCVINGYEYKNNADENVSNCTESSSIPNSCTSSNSGKTYVTKCSTSCPSGTTRIGSTNYCK